MRIFDLSRISFFLSLISPVFFLITIFGVNFGPAFAWFLISSTVLAVVLSSISFFVILKNKEKRGIVYSMIAFIIGLFFLFIWIVAFYFVKNNM